MSCYPSGVLQPSGLSEGASLHTAKCFSSPQSNIRWANAESRIAELLSRIQPNGHSELQRTAIADHVSGLVHKCLDCEVFKFGSVPLKTYLPDGDIDLTAFSSHQELKETWALDVQTVLEQEEQRKDAEFRVTKVQCIHAEVKIVKCVVENVVVDISFNQLGGLCTLCFLEEVDRLIQKNHLFKRSIILVKAWCYYESRILGAHHGLISTYALETLVLYIFNVFHSTLRGPMEVLFTFLNYFSKFDWERYCVSLWGPVALASLPDLTPEPPLKDGGKLLLSEGFLETCNALYDVFPKGQDTQSRTFSGKFLNIVDPLRKNNNLGRSVSQANYHRIRSAFHLGARKLVRVFESIDEDFLKYLDDFFSNTWERHQSGHRPDAPASDFLLYQMFVKPGCLDVLGHDSADDTFGLQESEKSIKKTNQESRASISESHSNILMEDISVETAVRKSDGDVWLQDSNSSEGLLETRVFFADQTLGFQGGGPGPETTKEHANHLPTLRCDMPLRVSRDIHLTTPALRSRSLGPSMTPKQRPDAQASLKRTVSEERKNLDADVLKSCRLPEDGQDHNMRKSMSEDAGGSPLKGHQSEGMPKAAKISSSYSNVSTLNQIGDLSAFTHAQSNGKLGFVRGKSWPTLDSCVPSDTVAPKPPEFLFPETHDLLHAPNVHSFRIPSFSSSSTSCVSVPSPFVHPLCSPELATVEANPAPIHATAVEVPLPTVPVGIPQWPMPAPMLPLDAGVQSMARSMPLLNGMNASQTPIQHQKEVEQQSHFWQQPRQDLLPSFKPVQASSLSNPSTSEVLPVSKVVGLELNVTDLSYPNTGPMPHAEGRRSGHSMGKASIRIDDIPLHLQDFAKTVKADDKMQPRRQNSLDSQIPYEGFEASRPCGSDGFKLPGCTPSCGQPFPTTGGLSEATIPGLKEVVHSVNGAVHQPVDYVHTSQSLLFGTSTATESLGKEGVNQMAQGAQTFYFPMGAFPRVSYYNPFYPVLPNCDHEFQANSSDPCIPHEDKTTRLPDGVLVRNPPHVFHGFGRNSESNAALSARFESLSAEGGMEPPSDLLSSDLANHLRNLEFGRWCQEPVLQRFSESPFIFHSVQGPVLWGVSPFTPVQGIARPFNQVLGEVNGLIPVPSSPQFFGGMPHILPGLGTSEFSDPKKQNTGTGRVLPARNGAYKDMKSLSPHIAAQYDQGIPQGKHGDLNTWRKSHFSTISRPSATAAIVAPPSNYGDFTAVKGIDVFGSSNIEHGARGTCLPNHLPGVLMPLAAGQLEFGSLGPIDITSFPSDDVGTKEVSRFSTGDPSSGFFSPFSDRDINQTVLNTPR